MAEKIKYEPEITLFPREGNHVYEIEPLKGPLLLNISTTLNRIGDRIIVFLSNLGSEKKISFDAGIDAKEFPVDRSGYLELIFNGKAFVLPFIGNLRGPEGKQGKQGDRGEIGPIGATGVSGLDGTSGSSGISIQGPKGEKGLDGTSGSSGISIQGEKGETGESGLNGLNGRSCTCPECLDKR